MSKTIYCQKLKKEAAQLAFAPYPGEMGEKVFENISEEAWKLWLDHQTMLINENRLNLLEPDAKKFLQEQMDKFLFSDEDVSKPEGYVPVEKEDDNS